MKAILGGGVSKTYPYALEKVIFWLHEVTVTFDAIPVSTMAQTVVSVLLYMVWHKSVLVDALR